MLRLPAWLVFVIFVPLQIYLFLQVKEGWGFWWTLLYFMVIGFLGNRASKAPFFQQLFFPWAAERWESRRHLHQGVLFLVAALLFVLTVEPLVAWGTTLVSWPALVALTSLVKASVR